MFGTKVTPPFSQGLGTPARWHLHHDCTLPHAVAPNAQDCRPSLQRKPVAAEWLRCWLSALRARRYTCERLSFLGAGLQNAFPTRRFSKHATRLRSYPLTSDPSGMVGVSRN